MFGLQCAIIQDTRGTGHPELMDHKGANNTQTACPAIRAIPAGRLRSGRQGDVKMRSELWRSLILHTCAKRKRVLPALCLGVSPRGVGGVGPVRQSGQGVKSLQISLL